MKYNTIANIHALLSSLLSASMLASFTEITVVVFGVCARPSPCRCLICLLCPKHLHMPRSFRLLFPLTPCINLIKAAFPPLSEKSSRQVARVFPTPVKRLSVFYVHYAPPSCQLHTIPLSTGQERGAGL